MKWLASSLAAALQLLATGTAAVSPGPEATLRQGTVETVAGSGVCPGDATTGSRSAEVGALAVAADGGFEFDTGPDRALYVGRVTPGGVSTRFVTGASAGPMSEDPASILRNPPSAGRLAPDGAGGVLIANGAKVVQVQADQSSVVVAGDPAAPTGASGPASAGDGGPAVAARFRSARSLAVDEAGDLFIADLVEAVTESFRVRMINRSGAPVTLYPGTAEQLTVAPGAIATVAGGGVPGGPDGDGGPALRAALRGAPPSLAVAGGRLYIATLTAGAGAGSGRLRAVNLTGAPLTATGVRLAPAAIDTVAGGPPIGGGPSPPSAFGYVPGMAATAGGDVLLADELHQRVLRLDPAGVTTTVAGHGGGPADGGFNGNGMAAASALLDHPDDVKAGPAGSVYIADRRNHQVRIVDATGRIRAASGGGIGLTPECAGGEAPQAGIPVGVAADPGGGVDVAEALAGEVTRTDPAGHVSVLATNGAGPRTPAAIAVDARGNPYVLDSASQRVVYINRGGDSVTVHGVAVAAGEVRSIVGSGSAGFGGDGGPAVDARLAAPVDISEGAFGEAHLQAASEGALLPPTTPGSIALTPAGELVVADTGNGRVRLVDQSGRITSVAGNGVPGPFGDCCHRPVAVASDGSGNLLVSDQGIGRTAPRVWFLNRGRRALTLLGRTVAPGAAEVVAGNGVEAEGDDGLPATASPLLAPAGMVLDRRGNLYLTLSGGRGLTSSVRRVDPEGIIATVAGGSMLAFNGDGLAGRLTTLDLPAGLALDACGNLLIADTANDRVRRLDLSGPCAPVQAATGSGSASGSGVWVWVAVAAGLTGAGATALAAAARRRRWRRG